MILPLPLVPFEEYMLADDRPAYPMSFFIRLRFSGRFARPALESAVRTAVGRHPLLSAVVRKTGRNRLAWVASDKLEPVVQWTLKPPGDQYPHAPAIDLHSEPGLRLWVLEGEQNSNLLLQFHHSCCDGLAALLLIEDLLVAYALATGQTWRQAALRPLDEKRLLKRGNFGLTRWKLLRMAPKQLVGLLGAQQFLMRSPVPIIPHRPELANAQTPSAFPTACTRAFDVDESAGLRATARREGTTVNDLLARNLFLALEDWRSRHHPGNDADWLRLSVPINLRTAGDRQLPASNVVSMVFLDRRPRKFDNPGRLLKGIHDEMQLIKQFQLGLTFVFSLRVFRALPGGLARATKADRPAVTCVLTNVGTALARVPLPRREGRIVAGNVVLEGMDCLAPIRPYTSAAFTLFKYAHKLNVTLHYDPRPLSPGQAEDLLDTFMRRGRESLQTTS